MLYKRTIEECGTNILKLDDESIEYYLFEQFSVDAVSFLHDDILTILLDEGLIDGNIYEESRKLRELFFIIENDVKLWNVVAAKMADEWRELMNLSDKIAGMLYC